MRPEFAKTSNVQRFLNGVSAVDERGASEASMMLVTGDPGYGKTATVWWWAIQHGAVYMRAKANYTPFWLLSDLVQELKGRPARNSEDLSKQVVISLARERRPIIIDEVEHTFRDLKVLETIRDIVDLFPVPMILVGTDQVQNRIARFAQFSSRIASVVQFRPATMADVRLCCDVKCEVPVADDLVEEIHRQSAGRLREVMNAIAVVERYGKARSGAAAKHPVTLSDLSGRALIHDWQARRPRPTGPSAGRPEPAAAVAGR